MKTILAAFIALFATSAFSQTVEFVRPVNDISSLLTVNQQQNLERSLDNLFPVRTLHRIVKAQEDDYRFIPMGSKHKLASSPLPKQKRITYSVIKQHGKKYAVVIFTASWKNEASQMAICKIGSGGYPTSIYRTHSWHSNFSDSYHEIQTIPVGKENILLIKEGQMGKSSYVVSSVFSFRQVATNEAGKYYCVINDLTPKMPRLKASAGFPLKTLYAQNVKLEKKADELTLQAGDEEYSWQKNSSGLNFWKYDKTSRKFKPEERIAANVKS